MQLDNSLNLVTLTTQENRVVMEKKISDGNGYILQWR